MAQEKKKAAKAGRGSRKASFQRWAAKFPKRRMARINRHMAKHPNDRAAEAHKARIEGEVYTFKPKAVYQLPKTNKED